MTRNNVSNNLNLMQFYEINICEVMIFPLQTVNNKHKMIKINNQIREKSQVLPQLIE